MGYPNPHESPYDLFMTGHAGCSVSTPWASRSATNCPARTIATAWPSSATGPCLGHCLRGPEQRRRPEERTAGHPQRQPDVDLPARRRPGRLSRPARLTSFYPGSKRKSSTASKQVPLLGESADASCSAGQGLAQGRSCTAACCSRNWASATSAPSTATTCPACAAGCATSRDQHGPVLLHVLTNKGHGVPQASADPVIFHTPPVFEKIGAGRTILSLKKRRLAGLHRCRSAPPSTTRCSDDPRVTVITAAMCQGNKLEKVRDRFPDALLRHRHLRVARRRLCRRAGQGRHAADRGHLFHLPAALLRPDLPGSGPAKPAGRLHARPRRSDRSRRSDAPRRLRHALSAAVPELRGHGSRRRTRRGPDAALRADARRPGVAALSQGQPRKSRSQLAPIELGQAEVLEWGDDGCLSPTARCCRPASRRPRSCARKGWTSASSTPASSSRWTGRPFCGPSRTAVGRYRRRRHAGGRLRQRPAGSGQRRGTGHAATSSRLGLPDRFVEHGERGELLADLGLDVAGICATVKAGLGQRQAGRDLWLSSLTVAAASLSSRGVPRVEERGRRRNEGTTLSPTR